MPNSKQAKLEAKIAALEFQIKETEEKQKGVDGKLKYEPAESDVSGVRSQFCLPAQRIPKFSQLPPFSSTLLHGFPLLPSSTQLKLTLPHLSRTTEPQATVKAHIKLLHDYNEIRDIGQGLIGIIAENRGARVSEVYKDFDVGEGD